MPRQWRDLWGKVGPGPSHLLVSNPRHNQAAPALDSPQKCEPRLPLPPEGDAGRGGAWAPGGALFPGRAPGELSRSGELCTARG